MGVNLVVDFNLFGTDMVCFSHCLLITFRNEVLLMYPGFLKQDKVRKMPKPKENAEKVMVKERLRNQYIST